MNKKFRKKLEKQNIQSKVKTKKSVKSKSTLEKNKFENLELLKTKHQAKTSHIDIFRKKWQEKKDARLFYENNKTEKVVKKIVKSKDGSLDEFNKTITSKVKRIKRRTLTKITVDKFHVLACVKALKGYFHSEHSDE